jgi:glycosyltransferase involved in cell wall biosynthesis
MPATDYLMVLPVPHFRVERSKVAVEGAFAEHLRIMQARIGSDASRVVVASPAMSPGDYASRAQVLATIDEQTEAIHFCTLFEEDAARSLSGRMRHLPTVLRTLWRLTRQSFCVHSGLSWRMSLPFEFASIFFGLLLGRRTVFVVDIDYRNSARMSYIAGEWSWKSYMICRFVHDAVRSLQLQIAARCCSLVLLKGRQMTRDFGSGRANVRYFLDAAHSREHLIDSTLLKHKIKDLSNRSVPVRLLYFGRLTAYKGVDRCIQAAVMARRAGANIELDIIGTGEQADVLKRLTVEYDASSWIRFHGGLPFNQEFFHRLCSCHLLLAAPLREDTPRSVLDGMAAGVPYLAFDTYYYRELLESGAGCVVPWPEVDAMARAIVELESNRERLISMVEDAVIYARANTQEIWLERRLAWILPNREPILDPAPTCVS